VLSLVRAAHSKGLELSSVRTARSKDLGRLSFRAARSNQLVLSSVRKASFKLTGPQSTPLALSDQTVQSLSRSDGTSRGLRIGRVRSGSRNASLAPRFSLHTRAPDDGMQPLDFDGEIVWDADTLRGLIPNDTAAARALPNQVFVQDRFQPGVFLGSTQRMIEDTADYDPSDNESDGVDEAPNSEGQDIPRYVKKRYPKRTKQHELMTSRSALGRRDTNIAR
jgi:hypothetical protein